MEDFVVDVICWEYAELLDDASLLKECEDIFNSGLGKNAGWILLGFSALF